MKRVTITIPDELAGAVEAYRHDQETPVTLTAIVEAAFREYLAGHGYQPFGPLHITPAQLGSGARDISVEHDKYFSGS